MNKGLMPIIGALAAGATFALAQQEKRGDEQALTYHRDIAPIIFSHCSPCHHSGGAGPFPLLKYEDVKKRSGMIAQVTASRFMPPWLAEKTQHEFLGERRLSEGQLQKIQTWIAGGALEGNPDAAPPPPRFKDDQWSLGEPDLVLTMPQAFTAPASGVDLLRTFVLPFDVDVVRPLRAIEFRPGISRAVHHASFLIDTTGTAKMLDGADPLPGYDGMGDIGFNHAGSLGAWGPGSGPFELPTGAARMMPSAGELVIEAHITPTGKPESVQASVGLYFAPMPVERLVTVISLGSQRIDIAAGEKRYVLDDAFTLPVDVEVIGLLPHAHFVCQQMSMAAAAPDQAADVLLRINDWDFNLLQPYRFACPVRLPAGTRLQGQWVFDNSADNPQNPHHPPERVQVGGRAGDEMALMLLYVSPIKSGDLPTLEEAHRQAQLKRMEDGRAFRAARAGAGPQSP